MSAILWTVVGLAALVFLVMIASVPAEQRQRRQRLRPRLVADLVAAAECDQRRR